MTPTREQIAATIHSVACPDCWIGSKYDLDIADALLREYEIRERGSTQVVMQAVMNALVNIRHDALLIVGATPSPMAYRLAHEAKMIMEKLGLVEREAKWEYEIRVKEEKNG